MKINIFRKKAQELQDLFIQILCLRTESGTEQQCKFCHVFIILCHSQHGRSRNYHGLQMPREEIAFTAQPKIHSEAYFVCHIGPNFKISMIYALTGYPQAVETAIYVVAGPHNWDDTVFGVAFQYIFNVLCSYMVKPDLCFSDVQYPKFFSCHIFACTYF